ncbi:hypothetical protein Syun_004241 [Stephania yunnanensis]|uniref:Uncharacterized protein n=1 Tax=Stephania yunnanensis TaxID=152371 RepID=A0AAP0L5Z1_9MAGN
MCTSYTYTTSHTTHHKQHRQYTEELVYIGEDYKLHDNTWISDYTLELNTNYVECTSYIQCRSHA